jgi:protein Tex
MKNTSETQILAQLATELVTSVANVKAAVGLLDEGATVPFISRYRKEVTGGLTDTHLRLLEERLGYLRELADRRVAILASLQELDKLTPELASAIELADTKQRLEDLYAPYKPKRRTKAQIAREAGLEPLALSLLNDPKLTPETEAQKYLNEAAAITTTALALEGARDILSEDFAQNADLLEQLRAYMWENALLSSAGATDKTPDEKFRDYFEFSETIKTVPSHRALALLRGRETGNLTIKLGFETDDAATTAAQTHPIEGRIASFHKIEPQGRAGDKFLLDCCRWAWRVKLSWSLESDALTKLKDQAQADAIKVFANNLKDLLLAPPAGAKTVLALDPGIRTGCKIAVVDATGKVLATDTIYPHEPRKDWEGSLHRLQQLSTKHNVDLIGIGNGTASRETDKLVADLIAQFKLGHIKKVSVSEAGASVYSASELAAKEFPQMDVSLRGAVSIARRLQDPLAELVKIDPKSIGVGQYQHDVDQRQLAGSLSKVVEDCVNSVGVDVNTASAALLARVSGLNSTLADNVVTFREKNGPFLNRAALMSVPRMGERTFEQAAGFLRIVTGDNPLDQSSVHPEAYAVVEKILAKVNKPLTEVMGNASLLKGLKAQEFADERFGLPTVSDVIAELEKPGRDPRPEFVTATFREGVESLSDLQPGMILEGVITNVTSFGAFVDIGVHQDGLVHISALSEKFVTDPRTVVKAADLVKVKVLEVDIARKRVALTMRLNESAPAPNQKSDAKPGSRSGSGSSSHSAYTGAGRNPRAGQSAPAPATALAQAFAKLKKT